VAGYADLPEFTGDLDGNRVQRSQAQIGHHGYEARTNYYTGDITVQFDGDIILAGGRYRDSGAKIGHQTAEGKGQNGGTFVRDEQFLYGPWFLVNPASADFAPINADASVTSTQASITVGGTTKTYDISGNTANITVEAGGDLTMQQSEQPGLEKTQNQAVRELTTLRNDLVDLRFVEVMIGHGGRRTGLQRNQSLNAQYNFKDKIGDITVSANDITMTNGPVLQWYTNIGHMFGNGDRFDASNLSIDRAGVLAGNISVTALGNLIMDAGAATATDEINLSGPAGIGDPARSNFVRIGHGGVLDNLDINVANSGDLIHGIAVNSNITVDVGNDMLVRAGEAELGGYAQVGHGFSSDLGNDRSRPAGFSGNIEVTVGHDLTLEAGSRAWIDTPGGVDVVQVRNAAAVIGHGGDMLEDELKGDITVFVGNDLNMIAAQRTQDAARDSNSNPAASIYGFTKIGHWSTSYQGISGGGFQTVTSNQSGDIQVVVGNDLNMQGGTTDDL
ncbi:MAG: hypothetical protein KDL10_11340, partial [Kiritimatiellae bacterium]|nr:hypothetical protein [Kiritimatiellia bacterium]